MLRILLAGAIAVALSALAVKQLMGVQTDNSPVQPSPIETVENGDADVRGGLNTVDSVRDNLGEALELEQERADRINSIE